MIGMNDWDLKETRQLAMRLSEERALQDKKGLSWEEQQCVWGTARSNGWTE